MTDQAEAPRPFLQVIRGDASPEELAALVAVVAALASRSAARPPRRRTPAWSHPARQVRQTFRHGAGGWRASGLPR